MKKNSEVILNVERWIKSIEVSDGNRELCNLGLLFCNSIYKGKLLLTTEKTNNVNRILKLPTDLINFNRDELLIFSQQLDISNIESWNTSNEEKEIWSQFLGGIAISYAIEGDLSVVAALVKAAAILNLNGKEIIEASNFILDQYQSEGYFGLYSEEINHLNKEQRTNFFLRLTVEVLWALAEQTHQLNRYSTNLN